MINSLKITANNGYSNIIKLMDAAFVCVLFGSRGTGGDSRKYNWLGD